MVRYKHWNENELNKSNQCLKNNFERDGAHYFFIVLKLLTVVQISKKREEGTLNGTQLVSSFMVFFRLSNSFDNHRWEKRLKS